MGKERLPLCLFELQMVAAVHRLLLPASAAGQQGALEDAGGRDQALEGGNCVLLQWSPAKPGTLHSHNMRLEWVEAALRISVCSDQPGPVGAVAERGCIHTAAWPWIHYSFYLPKITKNQGFPASSDLQQVYLWSFCLFQSVAEMGLLQRPQFRLL